MVCLQFSNNKVDWCFEFNFYLRLVQLVVLRFLSEIYVFELSVLMSFFGWFLKVGLALKPKTPIDAATQYFEHVDTVLIMTVEPGFGGQKFMTDMMSKVDLT